MACFNTALNINLSNVLSSSLNINIISFNMHGFNQGEIMLRELCSRNDLLLIQENWLTPGNLHKLTHFSNDFHFFGKSAIDVSSSILKGRPYGGVGILVKNNILSLVTESHISVRFTAIVLNKYIFISLYLPSTTIYNYQTILTDTICEIDNWLVDYQDHQLILGGDFNINLKEVNSLPNSLLNFIVQHNLIIGNFVLPTNPSALSYTYCHESLNQFSYLDYFLLSEPLHDNITGFIIYDESYNYSDHNPIRLSVKLDILSQSSNMLKSASLGQKKDLILRWDKSDLRAYYNSTYTLLLPTYTLINAFKCAGNRNFECELETIYHSIITSLTKAADECVIKKPSGFFKHWWSIELDALKIASIDSHNLWIAHGKPRNGMIFERRNSARLLYRKSIRSLQEEEHSTITNSLHDALLNKQNNNFWSTWKKKFQTKSRPPMVVDGLSSANDIANGFSKYFASHSIKCSTSEQETKTLDRLHNYHGKPTDNHKLSVELVDSIIKNLKVGKAAGLDNITPEHVLHSHPIVIYCLTKLFNLFVYFQYVPDAFGLGLSFPIPKDPTMGGKFEGYRGITISPLISKIFEYCLLHKLNIYLKTSDRQFGFKKKVGCRDIIHRLRTTIDHFVGNNATVNLCSVDLAKAFDKLDHHVLFNNLMDRGIPKCLLMTIVCWYDKLFIAVKWDSCISSFLPVTSGVRQGGILSPSFFSIVVDKVLDELRLSNLGCYVKHQCLNSFMYADDLILISISVSHLQSLLNVCVKAFSNLNLKINEKKCGIIRIGPRFRSVIKSLVIDNIEVCNLKELKYLGITIISHSVFTVNINPVKQKFFTALNNIIGKIGMRAPPSLLCSLIKAKCIPILLYSTESINLSNKLVKSIEHAYAQIFAKIFHSYDPQVVEQCQHYMNFLPIRGLLDVRKLNYLAQLFNDGNINLQDVTANSVVEYTKLCAKYDFQPGIWNYNKCIENFYAERFEAKYLSSK